MTELGRFHGECYGLKVAHRPQFDSMIAKFKESRYAADITDHTWKAVMTVAPMRAIKALKESRFKGLVPADYLEKLARLFQDPWEHAKGKVKPREPLAVICHGDYLRNNMAFRYADAKVNIGWTGPRCGLPAAPESQYWEPNRILTLTNCSEPLSFNLFLLIFGRFPPIQNPARPTQVMMFDFQTLRYASPMIDYAAFLANSTGYAEREHHFDTIFRTYHGALVQTVATVVGVPEPADLPPYFRCVNQTGINMGAEPLFPFMLINLSFFFYFGVRLE